jgi:acyl carrier protein phosphodiesterase
MNYLAHLFLAETTPESQIGNFLGDFVKGPLDLDKNCYSEDILKGIATHRQVDYFTDTHAIYLKSRRSISLRYQRFSGIIIDICYDHFLANHWSEFSDTRLTDFVNRFYAILQENPEILPPKVRAILPRIIAENWLASYQSLEGIRLTFTRLSRRFKREYSLACACDELIENYSKLEADFLQFFPELMAYVEQIK